MATLEAGPIVADELVLTEAWVKLEEWIGLALQNKAQSPAQRAETIVSRVTEFLRLQFDLSDDEPLVVPAEWEHRIPGPSPVSVDNGRIDPPNLPGNEGEFIVPLTGVVQIPQFNADTEIGNHHHVHGIVHPPSRWERLRLWLAQ